MGILAIKKGVYIEMPIIDCSKDHEEEISKILDRICDEDTSKKLTFKLIDLGEYLSNNVAIEIDGESLKVFEVRYPGIRSKLLEAVGGTDMLSKIDGFWAGYFYAKH